MKIPKVKMWTWCGDFDIQYVKVGVLTIYLLLWLSILFQVVSEHFAEQNNIYALT